MNIVTFKDLTQYIMNQPDERVVDMSSGYNIDCATDQPTCGCLMTQYGREKGLDFIGVNARGNHFWKNERMTLDAMVNDFPYTITGYFNPRLLKKNVGKLYPPYEEVTIFKDLKELIKIQETRQS